MALRAAVRLSSLKFKSVLAGMQGGSVVDHLLKAGTALRLRVPTRDPSSEAACKLRKRGVEVVQADLSKAEHLSAVFADAWAVFAVTTPTWYGLAAALLLHIKDRAPSSVAAVQGPSHSAQRAAAGHRAR